MTAISVTAIFAALTLVLAIAVVWLGIRSQKFLKERTKVLSTLRRINRIILGELDFEAVVQKVADAIPNELKFATGVVAILDEERQVLKRVAASRTKEAEEAIKALSVPFNKIEISVTDPDNLMAKALREHKSFITTDAYDVLGPVLSREEAAKIQTIMGTKTTVIHPIYMESKPLGVFLASTNKEESDLLGYELEIIQEFVNGAAIALQHATLYKSIKDKTAELGVVNERLKQLDQLKDDFVSVASHELRTPMTAIRSYAWMALHKSDTPLSDKLEKYLIRVLLSTERLIKLVNDMLNISRIESGRIEINPESVDLISLCKDIIDEVYYSKSTEKNVQFVMMEEKVPHVFADPEKLREVLLNLVGNAIKFTPSGKKIIFSFFTDGMVVETAIKDEGVGISKEDLGKLFQKFSRLDNSYTMVASSGGTGLGLYLSKSLVELMHGKIWADSEGLGKGSTFTVSLPVATQQVIAHTQDYTVKPKEGVEAKPLEHVII